MVSLRCLSLLPALLVLPFSVVFGEITLGGPFSDHMVIQADQAIPVWGTATPGAEVSVRFGESKESAVAGNDGVWRVTLPPQKPSKEGATLQVSSPGETREIHDVLVGELWLCSGQSNMRYTLGRHEVRDDPASPLIFPQELKDASKPLIRLLNVSSGEGSTPKGRRWELCSPETATGFSAIGYFFGSDLVKSLDVPVGLIDMGKGGESIRAFLAPDQIATDPRLESLRNNASAKEAGSVYVNDLCWLAPYALRGVLWYQGESDVTRADTYALMLSAMVGSWRADLQNENLPFLVVQLPGYAGKADNPSDQSTVSKWRPFFHEAQENFVKATPHTALASAVDLGEKNEIHPRAKKPVAERLALLARSMVYGQDVQSASPRLKSWHSEGNDIVLEFEGTCGGLEVRNGDLSDFEAAGADGNYERAEVSITAPDTVRVRGSKKITAVRYGWTGYFVPSLYNKAGLPSGSFRTDKAHPVKSSKKPAQPTQQSQPAKETPPPAPVAASSPSPEPLIVEAVGEKETAFKPRETIPLERSPGASSIPVDSALDTYGGKKTPLHKATGFFRVEKVGDRWWLIDPEGGEFFHTGVAAVRPLEGKVAAESLKKRFGDLAGWASATAALLKTNAFKGTGAWSDDASLRAVADRPVYTVNWDFITEFGYRYAGSKMGVGHTDFPNKCVPVFHPEFESFCEEHAKKLAALRDDPWLLGHFSDNELTFVRGSLTKYLELPPEDPGYQAALKWLRERHGAEATKEQVTPGDETDFLAFVIARYYSVVSKAVRRNDPNHLFLGSRFYGPERRIPEVFRAAGPYIDVVSMNWYNTWTPKPETLAMWSRESGRPVLVTEFYAKAEDSGLPNKTGSGFLVHSQRDRGLFYQNFTLALLRSKDCVGWHWFRYGDNDPEAGGDGSNLDANKGIVNRLYEPYAELLGMMKSVNERVYGLISAIDAEKH